MPEAEENGEDEIDLRSCVEFILRRKRIIFASTLLGMIVAVVVVWAVNHYTPQSFRATSTLRLGMFRWEKLYPTYTTQQTLSEEEIRRSLLDDRGLSSMIDKSRLRSTLMQLRKRIKAHVEWQDGVDLLKISAEHPSEKEAREICQAVHDAVLHYLVEKLSRQFWAVREELKLLQEKKEGLRRMIEGVENSLLNLRSKISPRSQTDKILIESNVISLRNALSYNKNALVDIELSERKYKEVLEGAQPLEVQPPIVSPLKKQKRLGLSSTMAVLGILGFLGGVFAAFLKDKKLKKAEK